MNTPDLFDSYVTSLRNTGEQLKTEGMEKAAANAGEGWNALFEIAARTILDDCGSVTAEEVVEVAGFPPSSKNAIGAAMNKFARAHGLVCTYEKSTRPSRHRAIIGRWRRKA